jgi:uncharacterized caspase-like protein
MLRVNGFFSQTPEVREWLMEGLFRMKSVRLTKNLSKRLKALALLGLIAVFSALFSEAQSQSAQQPANRLITHPEPITALPSQSKRWALLIGVDKYEDSNIGPLAGAANDANSLKETLVKYAGFPQDQVIVLSTTSPAERQPTRKNILKGLSNLAGLVPKDGLLLISFAGHGIDRNGRAFLIPSDATLTEDLSLLEETAVSLNHVKQRIKDTGVQQVMILLDACRAYPTGRSDSPNPLTPAFTNAFSFDTRNHEVVAFAVLYATAVGSRAYEYGEKHQGYFSWAIAQALSGAAANDRGEVTLRALVKYLEDRVPKLVALDYGAKVIQKPFAEIEGYRADELVLAVSTANKNASLGTGIKESQAVSRVEGNGTQPTPATITKKRGAKSGRVVITFALSERTVRDALNTNILWTISTEFTDPLASTLSKEGLSVTVPSLQAKKLDASPFAIIVLTSLSISDLSPYNGLNVAEVNGSLQAIDTDSTRSIRFNISRIRGFGNSQDQARRNALKNAAEGVSDSFIKQVAANAN